MNKAGLITKGVGGEYTVVCEDGIYICTALGVFRNRNITPFVGDHVVIDSNKKAIIKIEPRMNLLRRPPVANIDQVIVTMAAAKPAFHGGLLDRFLVLAAYENVSAVICINKYELFQGPDFCQPYAQAGYPVVKVSAETGLGLDELRGLMEGKLNVFAGPSGVGKSSLINSIIPNANMETGDISQRLGRGKHTTRHAEILPLENTNHSHRHDSDIKASNIKPPHETGSHTHSKGYCVDTPGFSSLEVDDIPIEAFSGCFLEFEPFLGLCKFSNCLHDTERDCAVKEQVGAAIHPSRYESYLAFIRRDTTSRPRR